jgi:glycosyltransferase involved in cell wall biosynthesis
VGLPHTETTHDFFTCAYTQKLVKFGKMMTALDYEVILYAGEENTAACTEHVPIVSREEQRAWFGEQTQSMLPTIQWDPNLPCWRTMNQRAVTEITKRLDVKNDLVLIIGGTAQKPIADALPAATNCEFGIGYSGIFSDHKVFESYAWMHHIYGRKFQDTGNFYDAVIPNYFDMDDFPYPGLMNIKGDYLLFVGRLIRNKGPQVACEIADRVGMPLVMAGNGLIDQDGSTIRFAEGEIKCHDVKHVGPVGIEERARLMAGAHAVLMPTLYLEPFGGVAVEAMLAGTPVIAPDWGAFTETILAGVSGFRFKTLREACEGTEMVGKLPRSTIRHYAENRYSLEAVGPMYDRYFKQLQGLWGDGWYG